MKNSSYISLDFQENISRICAMKQTIVKNTCSFVCVIIAGILAFYGKDGWGWFIFLAIVISCIEIDFKDEE